MRTSEKQKEKQLPLLQAETTWFHVFRHMIESGDAAKMGGTAFLVYCVVKSYTNWSTGRSFPGVELIAEKTKLSTRQVIRCLDVLREMEYVTVEKIGRNNRYTLREKVSIVDNEGRPAATAMWDYLPSTVEAARAELKNFLMSGDTAGAKIVHIENLTLNVNIQNIARGDGHVHTIDPKQYPYAEHLVAKSLKARGFEVDDDQEPKPDGTSGV
jgi:hypothetical protein